MKEYKKKLYSAVGALVQKERVRRGLSIGELSRIVDEQNMTIRRIEKGSPCSLHHLLWMAQELNISIADIYKYREIQHGEEEITGLNDLI